MAATKLVLTIILLFLVTVPVAETSRAEEGPFSDPFAYCAAVDDVDAPDGRYVGPGVPGPIVDGLRKALGFPGNLPQDLVERAVFWRCMGGSVWACFVGANLPCTVKADPSPVPSQAMKDFCRAESVGEGIPAYITGRATIYEWRCDDGEPKIVRRLDEADGRGFLSAIWYKIDAP